MRLNMNFSNTKWLFGTASITGVIYLTGVTSLQTLAQANDNSTSQILSTQTNTVSQSQSVVYVNSATGTDNTVSGKSEAKPYRTITYALSQGQRGTVIQLAPGNYTSETGEVFPLVIKSGITLRGNESTKGQTTVITGGAWYISPTFARQNIAVLAEQDSMIAGVTIIDPNTRGTAVWIESGSPTVKNSTFTHSHREGIFVTATASPIIESNIFTNNGGNGMSVVRAAKGEIRNNVFQETGFGLAIGGTASPVVANNQIIHNRVGVILSDEAHPVLRNNTLEKNQQGDVIIATGSQAQPKLAKSNKQRLVLPRDQ